MIYYLCHDIAHPSGGVHVLYQHVESLNRGGLAATILHGRRPAIDWFASAAPVVAIADGAAPGPGDVLVIPEDHAEGLSLFRDRACRRVLFCQNQFYAAAMLQAHGDWRRSGIEAVLCSSESVRHFAAQAGWPNAPLVPCALDLDRFRLRPKCRAVAYMPRKRPDEAALVTRGLMLLHPRHADVAMVALDGVGEAAVAAALGEAAVFLALGRHESLGLPVLEAMACGTLVAGFHGDGDFALPSAQDLGLWADTAAACIEQLATALDWTATGDPRGRAMVERAARHAAAFTPDARDAALLGFWRGFLAG